MDIRATPHVTPAPSAPTVPETRLPVQSNAKADPPPSTANSGGPAVSTKSDSSPPITKIRAELQFDDSIKRLVGRIVNETTGETVVEIPPEELISLYQKTAEMLGPLGDEKA